MNLIYLHGFASGPGSSKAQFFRARFEELGLEMKIPDLAEGRFEELTIGGQLRVVDRVATGNDVCLIGSSMGGYVAALHAARRPETQRLILLAPAFGFARRWPEWLGVEKLGAWRRTGSMPVYHYGEKRELQLGYRLLSEAEQYEDFPSITQPALIFHGRADDAVPYQLSEGFAARNPQVTLRVVDSGHELIDVLEDIWSEVRRFLEI
jgi:pimeloyl-ACP methyl ester carboxylesterase